MAMFDGSGRERRGGDVLRRTLLWFTPLVMANQLLYFAGTNLHLLFVFLAVGVAMGVASWSGCKGGYPRMMLGFVMYSLASVFLYIFHDVPLESYLVEVDKYLCAMAFFFVGANRKNTGDDYERGLLWGCLVCFLSGFWFYFAAPGWYSRRLVAMRALHWYRSVANEATILDYSRFSSFWGTSYAMGFFGMIALCHAIGWIVRGRCRKDRALGWAVAAAAWAACVLSQQRIAMGCSVLVVAANVLYAGVVERRKGAWWLAGGLAVGLALASALALGSEGLRGRFDVVAGQMEKRIGEMDFEAAMAERSGQYTEALGNWNSVWFGYGIGSASGYARSKQLMGVNDGNWVKVLYEQGLVGATWLVALVAAGLWRGMRRWREFRAEACITGFFALAAVGSNAFCVNGLYAMPFWYALGRLWNGAEWRRRAEMANAGVGKSMLEGARAFQKGRGGFWTGFGGRPWWRRWGQGGSTSRRPENLAGAESEGRAESSGAEEAAATQAPMEPRSYSAATSPMGDGRRKPPVRGEKRKNRHGGRKGGKRKRG